MQTAKDYDLIVNLFNKYIANKKTKSLTEVGFRKYLLTEQMFPSWLVKSIMQQIKKDPNLSFHIHTYLEHYILEGCLLGTIKEAAAKLVLKNKYGYEESPTKVLADKSAGVRTINLTAAVKPPELLENKGATNDT